MSLPPTYTEVLRSIEEGELEPTEQTRNFFNVVLEDVINGRPELLNVTEALVREAKALTPKEALEVKALLGSPQKPDKSEGISVFEFLTEDSA